MHKQAIIILYVIAIAFIIAITGDIYAGKETKTGTTKQSAAVYSTWRELETDKCASAWLIRRFVNANAQFKFFPKGTFIKEGIPFDTPDSDLKRDARMTVFGKVMQKYTIKNAVLDDMNRIIWDIEVNSWDKKVTPEAIGVDSVIQGLILMTKSEEECIEKSFLIFDALYAHFKSRRDLGAQK